MKSLFAALVLIAVMIFGVQPPVSANDIEKADEMVSAKGFIRVTGTEAVGDYLGVGYIKREKIGGKVVILGLTFSQSYQLLMVSINTEDSYSPKRALINSLNPLINLLLKNKHEASHKVMIADLLTAKIIEGRFFCGNLQGVCHQENIRGSMVREICFVDNKIDPKAD